MPVSENMREVFAQSDGIFYFLLFFLICKSWLKLFRRDR